MFLLYVYELQKEKIKIKMLCDYETKCIFNELVVMKCSRYLIIIKNITCFNSIHLLLFLFIMYVLFYTVFTFLFRAAECLLLFHPLDDYDLHSIGLFISSFFLFIPNMLEHDVRACYYYCCWPLLLLWHLMHRYVDDDAIYWWK